MNQFYRTVNLLENQDKNQFRILIVDDSTSARMKIKDSLRSLDVEILEADDGTTALPILKQDIDTIDLVLSDLIMKDMYGDKLCVAIRDELGQTELPVIILSSQKEQDTVIHLFQAGATDYLFKPFIPQELLARIQSHLEQCKLNKILRQNVHELSELNRMKDHFLAACSHDFRSPLQGIMGFTELLMAEDGLSEFHLNLLGNIMEAGKQLHDLIDSLLDFSLAGHKPEDIPMMPLDIVSVVHSCVSNISFNAENKNVSLTLSPPPELPHLKANPNALARIFSNILSNALKFSSPGGSITIEFSKPGDDCICVSITDTGEGISEDVLPIIFDRYSKASRQGTMGEKSTGLGLYITRQLVELHRGCIDVKSEINKGSCFSVTFPLTPQE